MLSWEWWCSWCADRRCSKYIWAINNCIKHLRASYIRGLSNILNASCTMPIWMYKQFEHHSKIYLYWCSQDQGIGNISHSFNLTLIRNLLYSTATQPRRNQRHSSERLSFSLKTHSRFCWAICPLLLTYVASTNPPLYRGRMFSSSPVISNGCSFVNRKIV